MSPSAAEHASRRTNRPTLFRPNHHINPTSQSIHTYFLNLHGTVVPMVQKWQKYEAVKVSNGGEDMGTHPPNDTLGV